MASTSMVASTAGANKLTELVVLARSAKGAAAVAIIRQATEHPALFAFGELLASPGIVELASTAHQPWLDILRIFAYGTYMDFTERAATLPALSEAQLSKLRMLTVVSLSYYSKNLAYDTLLTQLQLPSLRALEDLVMAAIYAGVVRAKLNQKDRTVEIESAIGRDVRPSDVPGMVTMLAMWHQQTAELVAALDRRVADISNSIKLAEQSRTEFETTVEQVRLRLSKRTQGSSEGERRGGDFSSQEYYDEDSRSRGKGRH